MKQNNIIVGIERRLDTQGEGADWNHKTITWLVLHHTPNSTKQHTIELKMTLLSSERQVIVDSIPKHRTLCSFGYKCEFDVSEGLKGRIQQDGFSFELFLNGRNYNQCAQQHYAYQPPKISCDGDHWLKEEYGQVPSKKEPPTMANVLNTKSTQSGNKQTSKPVTVSSKSDQKTEHTIKNSQNELMRLLIQQKKQRQAQKK